MNTSIIVNHFNFLSYVDDYHFNIYLKEELALYKCIYDNLQIKKVYIHKTNNEH